MKKIIKKLIFIFAMIILLSTIFPTALKLSEVIASEYKIMWNGKVTYRPINSSETLQ